MRINLKHGVSVLVLAGFVLLALGSGTTNGAVRTTSETSAASGSGSANSGQNTGVNPNSHYREGYYELWKRLPAQIQTNPAYHSWALRVKETGDYKGAFEYLVREGNYDARPEWWDYLAWVRGE